MLTNESATDLISPFGEVADEVVSEVRLAGSLAMIEVSPPLIVEVGAYPDGSEPVFSGHFRTPRIADANRVSPRIARIVVFLRLRRVSLVT